VRPGGRGLLVDGSIDRDRSRFLSSSFLEKGEGKDVADAGERGRGVDDNETTGRRSKEEERNDESVEAESREDGKVKANTKQSTEEGGRGHTQGRQRKRTGS